MRDSSFSQIQFRNLVTTEDISDRVVVQNIEQIPEKNAKNKVIREFLYNVYWWKILVNQEITIRALKS